MRKRIGGFVAIGQTAHTTSSSALLSELRDVVEHMHMGRVGAIEHIADPNDHEQLQQDQLATLEFEVKHVFVYEFNCV